MMSFKQVTTLGTVISMLLWVCAASFWRIGSLGSFSVTAVLAAFFQVLALQSAKREGELVARRVWFLDAILDEVAK